MSLLINNPLFFVLATAGVVLAIVAGWNRAWNAFERWVIDRRRAIFRFWDGRRVRGVDPIAVVRALRADDEYDEETHLKLADAGHDDAIRITAAAVRRAFGMAGFAGGGLTDLECLAVLLQFLNYLTDLKKKIGLLPNSPEPTGPASWPVPASVDPVAQAEAESFWDSVDGGEAAPTIPPWWESGSTPSELKPAEQVQ